MEEIWKDIPGYEGKYQASTLGRIRSLDHYSGEFVNNGTLSRQFRRGKIMKGTYDQDGYLNIALSVSNRKYKYYRIHRLVALTFIPTEDTSLQIDHINCIKDDNRAENLEWVSSKENINRAWKAGRCSPHIVSAEQAERFRQVGKRMAEWRGRPCRCLEDNLCFVTIAAAAKYYGFSPNSLWSRISSQNKYCEAQCNGLHFEYISKDSQEYAQLLKEFRDKIQSESDSSHVV